MNDEEYKKRMDYLEWEFEERKNALMKEYALSHNKYFIGDIFEDHIGKIRIKKMNVGMWGCLNTPSMSYYGDNLTKTGSINKREPARWACQINDIKKTT